MPMDDVSHLSWCREQLKRLGLPIGDHVDLSHRAYLEHLLTALRARREPGEPGGGGGRPREEGGPIAMSRRADDEAGTLDTGGREDRVSAKMKADSRRRLRQSLYEYGKVWGWTGSELDDDKAWEEFEQHCLAIGRKLAGKRADGSPIATPAEMHNSGRPVTEVSGFNNVIPGKGRKRRPPSAGPEVELSRGDASDEQPNSHVMERLSGRAWTGTSDLAEQSRQGKAKLRRPDE